MSAEPPDITPGPSAEGIPGTSDVQDQYFSTDHLQADLKGRSVRGGVVTIMAQGVKFCLTMASTMAMARLLVPAEFGVVAMVSPILGFIGMFKDLGLSLATVQQEKITHAQVSTLFWANVAASVALAAIAAAVSPLVGMFYGDSRTTWVTLVSAGTFLFGGLTAQHSALLVRNMRFGALAIIDICSMTGSLSVGVATAWMGWSYWSLVAASFAGGIVGCAAVWIVSSWRPGVPTRNAGTRAMFKFGGGMTVSSVIAYLCTQVDDIGLGKFYNPAGVMGQAELVASRAEALGVYSKAQSLFLVPLIHVMSPINSVMTPMFSRLASDKARLGAAAAKVIEIAAAGTLPVALLMFLSAEGIVQILFGTNPQWAAAVPIMRAFCLVALPFPVSWVINTLFTATGRSDVLMKWELCWFCLLVPTVAVSLRWGAFGVAVGVASAWFCMMPIHLYLGRRIGGLSLRMMGHVLLTNVVSAALCIGSVSLLRLLIGRLPPIADLIVTGTMILVFHGLTMYWFGVIKRAWQMLRRG